MRELAVQAASDGVNANDRDSLNLEVGQLKNEITRIAQSTEYNGLTLLTGSYDGATATEALTLQIGADNAATNQLEIQLGDFQVNSATFGKTDTVNTTAIDASSATFLDVDSLSNAQTTITNLDTMIDAVNNARGEIGASQNRLEFTSSNLMNSVQNNAASMSTIRDADFAAEAADLAKNQILVQSGTSMLAQANGLSQNVLALIR
jgi:flagellin